MGIAPIVPKAPADPKTFRELRPDFLEYRPGMKHRSVKDDARLPKTDPRASVILVAR